MQPIGSRHAEAHIESVFLERWSPRSFDAGHQLSEEDIEKIFEAARWAPSNFNEQPWSFHLALRNAPSFSHFLAVLNEGNRIWAKSASALVFIAGQRLFMNHRQENPTFAFDCGAAWMSLTLQARFMGLYTHGIAGFDRSAAQKLLRLERREYLVIAGFAIGRRDVPEMLPKDLQQREKMNDRQPLYQILEVYQNAL